MVHARASCAALLHGGYFFDVALERDGRWRWFAVLALLALLAMGCTASKWPARGLLKSCVVDAALVSVDTEYQGQVSSGVMNKATSIFTCFGARKTRDQTWQERKRGRIACWPVFSYQT